MSVSRLALCTLAAVVATVVAPSTALGSPWTLDKDRLLLDVNYDFQFAEREFLPDGEFQSFPLNGKFNSSTLRASGRYGFTSKLELAAEATVKSVNYTADAVVLMLPQEQVGLDEARAAVVSFSSSQIGPSDVFVTGRYNFHKGLIAVANETRLKLPTGYTPPAGTFDPETGAVADDVALGDGQSDLEDSILFGFFAPQTRTFGRVDAGFRLRFGAPGHQAIGQMKVGQFLGSKLVVFAGASGAITVVQGDVIGQTWVATEDDLQADEIVLEENAVAIDLRLDKDFLKVEGGLLFVPLDRVEIQASYSQIVLGSNIPAIRALSIGTAIRFDDITAGAE